MVAATTQNIVRMTHTHAPALPPGTTKGRGTLGYLRRRVSSAGKIRMYEKVVVEMTRPSTAAKKPCRLPPVTKNVMYMKIVAMMPEVTRSEEHTSELQS